MYKVTIKHHDKDWVKGDLEDKIETVGVELFNTRTNAKKYIEESLRKKSGKKYRDYHKGDKASYCYVYTGVTWQHENSGETMEEYYVYILEKIKAK